MKVGPLKITVNATSLPLPLVSTHSSSSLWHFGQIARGGTYMPAHFVQRAAINLCSAIYWSNAATENGRRSVVSSLMVSFSAHTHGPHKWIRSRRRYGSTQVRHLHRPVSPP